MELLKKHIEQRLNQKQPDSIDLVISKFQLSHYKKGETILRFGEVSKKILFVCKGCIQVLYIGSDDNLWTRDIIYDNQWCCNLDSFMNETASIEEIKCLEPTVVMSIDRRNFLWIREAVPNFSEIYQQIITEFYIDTIKRLQFIVSQDAKQRIKWFHQNKAELANLLTSKVIASYLHLNKDVYCRLKPIVLKEIL